MVMTPVQDDVLDPEQIRVSLPEDQREWFLAEYRAAAEAAVHDPARWGELRYLLHTWRLRALARSHPGYSESREQARTGVGEFTTMEDVIARRRANQ